MIAACVVVLNSFLVAAGIVSDKETVLMSFDRAGLPENMKQNNTVAAVVKHKKRRALEVQFQQVDWPNVFFTPADKEWDWSAYAGLAVDIFNPGPQAVDVCMRVDNEGADGGSHCNTGSTNVEAGQRATLQVRFNTTEGTPFWGMRGIPVHGAVGQGPLLDPKHIVAFQVFLPRPIEPRTLILEEVRLFGKGAPGQEVVPMPFVSRFGQYMHADWPGKLKDAKDFSKRVKAETRAFKKHPALPGRDTFGGWADGPQLDSTGWFRTQEVDGKWWLVTPSGHLFFSMGVDCIGTGERTFIEGRDGWFEQLPDPNDPVFKDLFSVVTGAHSMADRIGGKGRTFSFYRWNLMTKYGPEWPDRWRDNAYARLQSWGFNTIGNWSQDDVLKQSPMPFTACIGIGGAVREIAGASGYWGRMKDVFDPSFTQAADAAVAAATKPFAGNPLCIGYFVDNEMSWETVREGTLASPPDQPCRKVFVDQLQARYGGLEPLNAAWKTNAQDWDSLRVPALKSDACVADLDAFEYQFAKKYFETVNTAIKVHAPHHLYLGCRFSSTPKMAVQACADIADVVSYNLYYRSIPCEKFCGKNGIGKPILIGEFHFGALDRGMFHTGLVPTKNQQERAASYIQYLERVADCPSFVGCHWFQYVDEPLTGRWYDGENYNIGFVDITDTPYPEMVRAAKKVHGGIYERRFGKK